MKEFFIFLKNKIIEAVTGRRPYQEEFDDGEKGYQVKKYCLARYFEGNLYSVQPTCANIEISILRERTETLKIAMGYIVHITISSL